MKNNSIDITVLLDRSGSMESIKHDMEGGFATFLEDQKKAPGETRISLCQFDAYHSNQFSGAYHPVKLPAADGDDWYQAIYSGLLAKDAPPLRLVPRGGTALLDAMARCIDETGARLAALPESQRPEKVLFVVITDGQENSSRHTTRAQVAERVKRQTDVYKWDFIYLGADHNAFHEAQLMGININNVGTYEKTGGGVMRAFACTTSNSYSLRAGQPVAVYLDDANLKHTVDPNATIPPPATP